MEKKFTLIQKFAWAYAIGFFVVVLMGHIPFFVSDGKVLGFYGISPFIDTIHFMAGVLAALAAYSSHLWSVRYFKFIAIPFGGDAVVSFLFSRDITETGSIFTQGLGPMNLTMTNIIGNFPHILLAGFALWVGFVLSKKAWASR